MVIVTSEMHGHHILFTDKAQPTTRPRGQILGGKMSPCSPKIRAIETEGKVDDFIVYFCYYRGDFAAFYDVS